MAIQQTGPISLTDLAAEFNDTAPHSMSEFYRNGGKVPDVNSNVPTSGAIGLQKFYGAVNEIAISAVSAANLNLATVFGSNWGVNVPKRLVIPYGVILGPLSIPTGMAGTLIVQNSGEIQGLGGAANGGAGGHAITSSQTFTLINTATGAVRGGGGGGGSGGTGGAGGQGGTGRVTIFAGSSTCQCPCAGGANCPTGSTKTCSTASCGPVSEGCRTRTCSAVYNYFSGGAGGAGGSTGGNGGVGQGYNQAATAGSGGSFGSAGSAGGTNAGAGGTGGNAGAGGSGSAWATAGASGSAGLTGGTGANGNFSNGQAGVAGAAGNAGGAAGRAILMTAGSVTVQNNGTINGAF